MPSQSGLCVWKAPVSCERYCSSGNPYSTWNRSSLLRRTAQTARWSMLKSKVDIESLLASSQAQYCSRISYRARHLQ